MKRFAALLLATALAGCAGYRIGPAQPMFMKDIRTIAVPTFQNETLEPRIEVLAANAVIRQFQQDGTYAIARTEQADALLTGTILLVQRRPARSVRGNVLATREFILNVQLGYKVTRRSTGEVLDESTVTGSTNFFVSSDVQQDERQAIPLAAENAAVALVARISEGW